MNVDELSIAARAFEFVTVLQAMGVALFWSQFKGCLRASESSIRALG
jgi:hypothetical protein